MNPTRGGWLIPLTLIGAMLLTVAHLAAGVPAWLRPDWAVALFLFWTITAPGRTGLVWAWITGLLFDVLLGDRLGLHGFGFALTTFLGSRFQERLLMYSLLQQTAVAAVIAATVQAVNSLARALLVDADLSALALVSILTTMLAYPLLSVTLRPLANRFMRQ